MTGRAPDDHELAALRAGQQAARETRDGKFYPFGAGLAGDGTIQLLAPEPEPGQTSVEPSVAKLLTYFHTRLADVAPLLAVPEEAARRHCFRRALYARGPAAPRRPMRWLTAAAFLLGVACSSKDGNMLRDYAGSTFQPGQVWRYHTRPGEDGSSLTVLKVETHPTAGTIVHIAVSGVRVRTPAGGTTAEIGHLPVAEEAVRRSVTEKVGDGAPTDRGMDGYREWRRAFDAGRGGVFSTTVAECVGFVEQAMAQPRKR